MSKSPIHPLNLYGSDNYTLEICEKAKKKKPILNEVRQLGPSTNL